MFERNMQKKGQANAGLVTGLVFGIASLIVGVIIAFVLISTLSNANLLTSGRTTYSVINETGNVNASGYTVSKVTSGTDKYVTGGFTITSIINATSNVTLATSEYAIDSVGLITNGSNKNWENVKIIYTWTEKADEEASSAVLSANFSAGVDNVSAKIPTVLLIAAIVLILGVLAILVGIWQRMRMGNSDL